MKYLALHRHNYVTFSVDRETCEAEAHEALQAKYPAAQLDTEYSWLDISLATEAAVEAAYRDRNTDAIDLRSDGIYDLIENTETP